jgi:hypothetical protein
VNKSLHWSRCDDHPLIKLGRRHVPTQVFILLARLPHVPVQDDVNSFGNSGFQSESQSTSLNDMDTYLTELENRQDDAVQNPVYESSQAHDLHRNSLTVMKKQQRHRKRKLNLYTSMVNEEDEIFHFDQLPVTNRTQIVMIDHTGPPRYELRFDFYCLTIILPTETMKKISLALHGNLTSSVSPSSLLNPNSAYPVTLQKCSLSNYNPNQWFRTLQGLSLASKIDRLTSCIESYAYPGYCVIAKTPISALLPGMNATRKNDLYLVKCDSEHWLRQTMFEIELVY